MSCSRGRNNICMYAIIRLSVCIVLYWFVCMDRWMDGCVYVSISMSLPGAPGMPGLPDTPWTPFSPGGPWGPKPGGPGGPLSPGIPEVPGSPGNPRSPFT